MKVLQVIDNFQSGGVQRTLLPLLVEMRRQGAAISICCLTGEQSAAKPFLDEGFHLHFIRFRSRLDPLGLFRLRWLIRGGAFKIIHGQSYSSNMAINLAAAGSAVASAVNTYHNQKPVRIASQRRMIRWTRPVPTTWIVSSGVLRDALVKAEIPEAKIRVIYKGVKVGEQPPSLPRMESGDPLRLIAAGRFVKQQRNEFLLRVVKKSQDRGVSVHLTIVGDGPRLQRIKDLAAENGLEHAIDFPGKVDDITPFLDNAEIYISARTGKGPSRELQEACARGRPMLLSPIPPHQELAGDSQAARITRCDSDAWIDVLSAFWENRDRLIPMANEAFALAKKFSIESTAGQTLKVYHEILK